MTIEIQQETAVGVNEVVANLREAYKHIAVASALLEIEPDDSPSIKQLAQGILKKTVEIGMIDSIELSGTTTNLSITNAHHPTTTETSNGNGFHSSDNKQGEIDQATKFQGESIATRDKPNEHPENDKSAQIDPEERTVAGIKEDIRPDKTVEKDSKKVTVELAQPISRESDVIIEQTIDIIGPNSIKINGTVIRLSENQVVVLSSLLLHRNKLTHSSVLNPTKNRSYPSALRALKDKITVAGLDGDNFILKKGDKKYTQWQINPVYDFRDLRIDSITEPTETDTVSRLGNTALEGIQESHGANEKNDTKVPNSQHLTKEHTKITPPILEFAEDIASARDRRRGIFTISNLEQLNKWVEQLNPYNPLPRIVIAADNRLIINDRNQNLSPDQVELFNILLSSYGKNMTQSAINQLGYNEHLSSAKRIESFQGSFRRLNSLLVGENKVPLVSGSTLNGRDFMIDSSIQIIDDRKNLKKK